MPKSVHDVFEEFVSSLNILIKQCIEQSVKAATADFFASKCWTGNGEPLEAPVKKVNKVRKPGRKAGPKPVKLSKHGKRIGRPPKMRNE